MLIKCPECQSEVSSQASSCPKCGNPISAAGRSAKDKFSSFFSFIKSCVPSSDSKKKISPDLSRRVFLNNALHNIQIDQRPFPQRERDYSIFPGLNVETDMMVRIGLVHEITRNTMLKIYGISDQEAPLFDTSRPLKHIKERDIDPFVNILCDLIPQLMACRVELSAASKSPKTVSTVIRSFAFDLLEYEDIDYKVCKKIISDKEYVSRMEDVWSDSPDGNKKWLYAFRNSNRGANV